MTKKILIIEDEAALRMALEEKFRNEGFEVLSADNGEDGLALALDMMPDLILLDIILPKLNGFGVLTELAKHEEAKKIDVIILTNLSDAGNIGEVVKRGVSDYLVKADWTLEELAEKVRNKLK